jgi:hypothetical protein
MRGRADFCSARRNYFFLSYFVLLILEKEDARAQTFVPLSEQTGRVFGRPCILANACT